jgi:exodeoxyribonuclease V beta subunit
MITEFDPVETRLENGFSVIEASAGTGKTTTISAIVLRLIVDLKIEIENILVATYTELATAELRGRIRDVLAEARACARGGKAKWPFISAIIARIADRKEVERELERALQNFDEAPIFTIHGFCARVLAERAFEAGVLFETELVTDQSRFLHQVADDFWRAHLYGDDKVLAALLRERLSPARLVELLIELTNNPALRVLPAPENQAELKKNIAEVWRTLCECWSKSTQEIRGLFSNIAWAKGNHFKREVVDARLAAAMGCIGESRNAGDLLSCVEFFSAATLQANTRVRGITPKHEFFDRCQELSDVTRRFVVSFQSEFCQWAREELRRRKADEQVRSFDDLLTRLDEALRRDGQLCKNLRERFRVALIDEFQDTDPVQYSILAQIYAGTNARVFLIGDPKQAIYGFRGADVFAYLEAAKLADRRYTLGKNWRSERKLVDGVGEIFRQRDDAFVIPGIDLAPVKASGSTDETPLTINRRRDQPLRFWIAPLEQKANISRAVAAEIARLLVAKTRIGAEKIRPSEIAVLVMTNAETADIQKALSQFRILSVVYSAASVFESEEAEELSRVLLAVAEPTREKIVRAALATELFEYKASELEKLFGDDSRREKMLNRFADYQELWRDKGFIEMMRKFVVEEKVRPRLLAYTDGERRLTNLLHLVEVLHAACVENRFGIDGAIGWLTRQISERREIRDEYELRLESDENAVRIVTIHKSKGLEYDITLCPSVRKEPYRARDLVKFHDREAFVLDLEEKAENEKLRDREELAELVRQLYVGTTRARHRGYLVWPEKTTKSKSALAWLLSSAASAEAFLEKKGEPNTGLSVRNTFAGSDAIAVEDLPEAGGEILAQLPATQSPLAPRVFTGEIDRSWGISSFSSLISGRTEEPETPDYDSAGAEAETAEEAAVAAEGIHAFPGGMRAGTCLHLILEELDFTDLSQLRPLVIRKLADFRFENFDDAVCEMLEKTLRMPLGKDGFRLSEISRASRLSELEFTFPITALTTSRLRKVFQIDELPLAIDRLQFAPANGFMKGFIDLVFERAGRFYFVDWKSNWLGTDASSYVPQKVGAEMTRNFYNLQLTIYTVALHRYLQQRLGGYDYEKNFGGAFYIFLRGIDSRKPNNGIFFARPPHKFVQQLNEVFHGNAPARN